MENSFKVGDRVRCIKDVDGFSSGGKLGVICRIDNVSMGVAFDEEIFNCIYPGHTCGGFCADGHGLWCPSDDLVPAIFKKASEREYITEI